ncbi:GlsB/YeaQ/YmgE family stress response membrane protein [Gephyromycinifex aptenodytis]|uniref:GlsB/YeaQ/YmgE family stress response membrane protein n=1 Tax=Gephyromycinifex aptenodytis TaxID=2716227 RepID=UPI0021F8DF64|nr:GlsB/YeaQ/YmgE family stress response membrane protein [Gephyromycinifex aptenodytis]
MTLSMGFIGWIIIGGLAGWIASKIMGTDAQQGWLMNVIVGIVGGLLGGYLMTLVGFNAASGGIIFSLLTAIIGAVLLLWIVGKVTGSRR